MRFALLTLTLLTTLAARGDWSLEPKDFRGVPFPGASKNEVMTKLGLERRWCLGKDSCLDPNFMLADYLMPTSYQFANDRLVQIFMLFPAAFFDGVKEIFIERYGPPTKVEKHAVRTKGGVDYENEIVTWTGKVIEVELTRYSSTVEESTASFDDLARKAEREKAAEEAKKKAARSF